MTGNSVFLRIVTEFWGDMRGPIFNRLGELSRFSVTLQSNIADHERIRNAVAARVADAARRARHDHQGMITLRMCSVIFSMIATTTG
jgi:DNA-binding FadR family transcriptional regulator